MIKISGFEHVSWAASELVDLCFIEISGEQERAADPDAPFDARRHLGIIVVKDANRHFGLCGAERIDAGLGRRIRVGRANMTEFGHSQSPRNPEGQRLDGPANDQSRDRVAGKSEHPQG